MKQENARLKEKLDTLQQEHAKLSTAAKDSKAALQEKVERLQRYNAMHSVYPLHLQYLWLL